MRDERHSLPFPSQKPNGPPIIPQAFFGIQTARGGGHRLETYCHRDDWCASRRIPGFSASHGKAMWMRDESSAPPADERSTADQLGRGGMTLVA
jgi:hypothetical protein